MKFLRETYGESILFFFFPGIVAWIAALAGYSFPLDKGHNLLVFAIFWFILESLIFLFFVIRIENRKGMIENILGCALFCLGCVLGAPLGTLLSYQAVSFSEETNDEDAEKMYFAGVAAISALTPAIIAILLMLFLLIFAFMAN